MGKGSRARLRPGCDLGAAALAAGSRGTVGEANRVGPGSEKPDRAVGDKARACSLVAMRRGSAAPKSRCIAAARSFATSTPHWAMTRWAAVVESWQRANNRCRSHAAWRGVRAATSCALWNALATASAVSSTATRMARRSVSSDRRRSLSKWAPGPELRDMAASTWAVVGDSPRLLASDSAALRRVMGSGARRTLMAVSCVRTIPPTGPNSQPSYGSATRR
jgi:hypothetical protein